MRRESQQTLTISGQMVSTVTDGGPGASEPRGGPTAAPRHHPARNAADLLAHLSWFVLVAGLLVTQVAAVAASDQTSHDILMGALAAFFVLLIARLAVTAVLRPGRRTPLLLAGIVAWALGPMSVTAARSAGSASFPAPGEWLFLASYLGMAGYLVLDVEGQRQRHLRAWLDVAVIVGGTTCLATLLLVTPVQLASGQGGLSLLLALIYPLADLALACVVLGQVVIKARSDLRTAGTIGLSFVLLAAADSSFTLQVSAGRYDFGTAITAVWGLAWALLVTAACRPDRGVLRAVPRQAGTGILVGAGAVAAAALAIRPADDLLYYTLPPAVLTLAVVGARMVLALNDAKRTAEAIVLSRTDDLTSLPNRRAVRQRLRQSGIERQPVALMFLDLDGFKEINDSLGHAAGDTVLQLVALRLQEALPDDVMVGRLGGDEFAVVVDSTDEIELLEMARAMLTDLSRPIVIDGIELALNGSVGIATRGGEEVGAGEIMRRADVAMYQAKTAAIGAVLYDAELDQFSRSRLQMAEELRRALSDGQIEVWYQPQVDLHTGRACGLEALVRWRHPAQGLISPVSFLPAARRAGLMEELSIAVVSQTLDDVARWSQQGLVLTVAVNCAPAELLSPTFQSRFHSLLDGAGLARDQLVLEVTEDSFLADPQRTRDTIQALRAEGVQISIDDYGTGFSSLTYLRNLPVQELTIDRSLIVGVAADERTRMIVGSTIQLAHALDLRIVAEGLDNEADLAVLSEMGIDVVQGYHLARPMPATEVCDWVRSFSMIGFPVAHRVATRASDDSSWKVG